MARDNKSLGMFHLDGIPAAPRGVPQIEVTFDIDANGIVHVSAKDLGTSKEQSITITSSTNMSKDDIEKAVQEAEQFAAEDKKKREAVDARNAADQMVFAAEKLVKDMGDKLDDADKALLEEKKNALKTALDADNAEGMAAASEELQKVLHEISQKVYSAAGAEAQGQPGAEQQAPPADDGVVDADFKEV